MSDAIRLAGVIGHPVAHSRSPLLHRFWLRRYGIDGDYVKLPVAPGGVRAAFAGLAALGFRGANVTVPWKIEAFRFADRLDRAARRIGAVNTLVVAQDGRLEGRNTDAHGFLANLRSGAPGFDPSAAPAVLLGAGGAARAVAVALLDAGCPEVRLLNRTVASADSLASALGGPITVFPMTETARTMLDAGLLVNATSLGMSGQPALEIDLSALPAGAVVNDIVYTPLETPLLAAARARGLRAVDGLGMLIHQAAPAFEAFFGLRPEVDAAVRSHLVDRL